MNDAWGYNTSDDDQGSELNGPKALREAYAALKKQNEELNSMVTTFIQDQKKQNIAKVFDTLGVPAAAELYTGDADPQKAAEWVQSMQQVFGGGQGQTPQVAAAPEGLNPQAQEQYQRMTQAGSEGVPMGSIESAQAAVGSANSLEDLKNIWLKGTFS